MSTPFIAPRDLLLQRLDGLHVEDAVLNTLGRRAGRAALHLRRDLDGFFDILHHRDRMRRLRHNRFGRWRDHIARFIDHGDPGKLLASVGLDGAGIRASIEKAMSE